MEENYCYIVDSGMQILKVKQKKIQELLDNKVLQEHKDVVEQIGNEDITDLIDYLLCEYKIHDKYNLQYIVDYLNDLICEKESEEE